MAIFYVNNEIMEVFIQRFAKGYSGRGICPGNNVASRKCCVECGCFLSLTEEPRINWPVLVKFAHLLQIQEHTCYRAITHLCRRIAILYVYLCLATINGHHKFRKGLSCRGPRASCKRNDGPSPLKYPGFLEQLLNPLRPSDSLKRFIPCVFPLVGHYASLSPSTLSIVNRSTWTG